MDDPDFLRLLEAELHMLLNENKIIKQLRFNEVSSCESADNKPTRWNQNPSHDDTLAAPIFIYFFMFMVYWGGNNSLLAGRRNFLESPPAPEIKLTLITLHMWYRWLNPSLRCRPFSPSPSFYGVRPAHLMR